MGETDPTWTLVKTIGKYRIYRIHADLHAVCEHWQGKWMNVKPKTTEAAACDWANSMIATGYGC